MALFMIHTYIYLTKHQYRPLTNSRNYKIHGASIHSRIQDKNTLGMEEQEPNNYAKMPLKQPCNYFK